MSIKRERDPRLIEFHDETLINEVAARNSAMAYVHKNGDDLQILAFGAGDDLANAMVCLLQRIRDNNEEVYNIIIKVSEQVKHDWKSQENT